MTPRGETKLKDFEGLRLKPYYDTVGKLTIGWGRNLADRGISHAEATLMLQADIEIATAQARQYFAWFDSLDEVRQDFIVMMIFNVGINGLLGFKKMIEAISERDWQRAGHELHDSKWRYQVGPVRAGAMRSAIETGTWDS